MRKLEHKYGDDLAVVGVHTPKFPAERETFNVRYAAHRHRIEHPVVNDRDFRIWHTYGVRAWPTLVFVDPAGQVIGYHEGEASLDALDTFIGDLVATHRRSGALGAGPLDAVEPPAGSITGLAFPGKLLAADDGRLFVADSGHHRILEAQADGVVRRVFGSGEAGDHDGPAETAAFAYPQGLALVDGGLYVADTENHKVRRIDLESGVVATVAGTGVRGYPQPGAQPAALAELASPWDLAADGQRLFIAMAGMHQIWVLHLNDATIGPYAGSGAEDIEDGDLDRARLAQPSGLALANGHLLIADSETSAIRVAPLDGRGQVATVVGAGLFEFGDVDGDVHTARLQHPLGIAAGAAGVYLADTFNNKIKTVDLDRGIVTSLAGAVEHGHHDGAFDVARFHEPGGLSLADRRLFVADTNNHAIRVLDLAHESVDTLHLLGLDAF